MKILLEKHGSKEYVYLHTSRRIPGKENPVTVKRYIGIKDSETDMIIPKKCSIDDVLSQIHDGEFITANYGSVLLAKKAAEKTDIYDILEKVPNENKKQLLWMVIARAIDPNCQTDYAHMLTRFYFGSNEKFSNSEINRVLNEVQSNFRKWFPVQKTTDRRYILLVNENLRHIRQNSVGNYYRNISPFTSNKSIFIVTNDKGMPEIIRSSEKGAGVVDNIRVAMGHANKSGDNNVLVLTGHSSLEVLSSLAIKDIEFIADGDHFINSTSMNAYYNSNDSKWKSKQWRGHKYEVQELVFNATITESGWTYSYDDGTVKQNPTIKMNAYLWYSIDDYIAISKTLKLWTQNRISIISQLPYDKSIELLSDGSVESHLVKISKRTDGGTSVSVKRNERKSIAINSCIHLFVTISCTWEECMNCIDLHRRILSNSEPVLGSVMECRNKYHTADILISFLAIKIRIQLENMLTEAGLTDVSVDSSFRIASGYSVVQVNDRIIKSSLPIRTRKLFEVLDIDSFSNTDFVNRKT